jgi:hypothetical protein
MESDKLQASGEFLTESDAKTALSRKAHTAGAVAFTTFEKENHTSARCEV